MAPVKTAARSRRTHSYSWSSDSSALRPVYQWPDLESTSSGRTSADDMSDGVSEHEAQHQTSPSDSNDVSDLGGEGKSMPSEVSQLGRKMNYDSDSCLTPRSRRTLRRTLSGDTEPWPSVKTPVKPALDTIYSPTHEILHPMQSLLLEKSLSNAGEKSLGSTAVPVRRAMSVDFDSRRNFDPAPKEVKPNPFKFETYAFPEPQLREEDETSESTLKTEEDENENFPGAKAKNVVVIIVDAEKKLTKFTALDWAINVAVQPGDEIVVLGVLKHVSSPTGYKVVANTDPLVGVNQEILQSEVKKTTEVFEHKLTDSGRRAQCEKKNVKLTVRIAPGARARTVVVRELAALTATYAVFDRYLN
ncbi:hypothetical protein M758_8G008700 [Ceratodon purpureus]|uniref:Uncharacterized protein n=1 Tax=Ceratodon purpureus TaxID=3225 RepID=A0A8T0GVW0_CERPU|nr:hypothetical protein KC19_8G009300 [Ceratodon purpureus]KAG0607192.1 hypothetical protein M758_8G008700 [Ceratodon purpureus]